MHQHRICELCKTISNDFKRLDESPESCSLIEKYFNLKAHITTICLKCCSYLNDFYNFEQRIFQIARMPHLQQIQYCLCCSNFSQEHAPLAEDIVYNVVAIYLKPMFAQLNRSRSLCLVCWLQIFEFYEFQKSIIQAQTFRSYDIITKSETQQEEQSKISQNVITSNIVKQEPLNDDYVNGNSTHSSHNVKEEVEFFSIQELAAIDSHIENQSCGNTQSTLENAFIIKSETDIQDDQQIGINNDATSVSLASTAIKKENDLFALPELELIDVHSESQFGTDERSVNRKTAVDFDENIQDNNKSPSNENENDETASSNDDSNHEDIQNSCHLSQEEKRLHANKLDEFIARWKPNLDCSMCSLSYSNFTALQRHYRWEHPGEECFILCCQIKLRTRYYLAEHVRFHLNPNAYKCKICGQMNTTRLNLKRHTEYWHSDTTISRVAAADTLEMKQQSPNLTCNECGKTSKTLGAFRKHMHRHEAKRKFKCHICDKGFRGRNDLRTHLETHTQSHMCTNCPMSFKYRSKLDAHIKSIHSA